MEKLGVVVTTDTENTEKTAMPEVCPICGENLEIDLSNFLARFCSTCGTAPFEK